MSEKLRSQIEQVLKEFIPIRDYSYINDDFVNAILELLPPTLSREEIIETLMNLSFVSGDKAHATMTLTRLGCEQIADSLTNRIPVEKKEYDCQFCGKKHITPFHPMPKIVVEPKEKEYCVCKFPKYYISSNGLYHNFCEDCHKPLVGTINVKPLPKLPEIEEIVYLEGWHSDDIWRVVNKVIDKLNELIRAYEAVRAKEGE
jgi:hypothetical protein